MLLKIKTLSSSFVNLLIKTYSTSSSTIYSVSSGQGKCGVAVIRVSGLDSLGALMSLTTFKSTPTPRYAYLKKILHPKTKEFIDRGLVLWFPGPASFTGEDSCEFHVHGGRAVVAALLEALGGIRGLRPAEPGEYTKRAFFSGKMDLTEAEGIADLIHAETEMQRKLAVIQANGHLAKKYNLWRDKLKRILAHFEAFIDFGEDENFDEDILRQILHDVQRIEEEITQHIANGRRGEILRDGVRTTIVGAPNVGKSSFINILGERPVSIVTDIPGTTRDIVEISCNIGGYPVIISDTAGLRKNGNDIVEDEGMSRARECAKNSDFTIILMDATKIVEYLNENPTKSIKDYIEKYLKEMEIEIHSSEYIFLVNKTDLISQIPKFTEQNLFWISCKNSFNLQTAIEEMSKILKNM